MRNGKVIWRTRPRGGKMASSPAIVGDDLVVHGMDGIVRVLDRRQRQAPLALPRRLADRVLADRPRRPRLLRRLERPRLRARPEAPEAALELARRLQDHVERRDRRQDALHRRLRRPAARALHPHRQAALLALGQRPRLRDAGGRGRARLRSLLDRQQPHRLHDERPLPLAGADRRLRLLVPGGLGRPRLLRLLQRPLLLRLGEVGPGALERRRRRAGVGRRGRRRRRRVRGLDLGPDHGRRREERPRRPQIPARRVRARLRQRPPPAPARLLARLGCRAESDETLVDRRRDRARPARGRGHRRLRPLQARGGQGRARLLDRGVRHDRGGGAAPAAAAGKGAARGRLADERLRRGAAPGRAVRAEPAVPPRLDVPRATAARVPAGDRLRAPLLHEQLRRHVRRSTRRPASGPGRSRSAAASPPRPRWATTPSTRRS